MIKARAVHGGLNDCSVQGRLLFGIKGIADARIILLQFIIYLSS
jgi:hypothetical protein